MSAHPAPTNCSDPDWRTRHCGELAFDAIAEARGCDAADLWAEVGGCPRNWREAAAVYRRMGVRTLDGFMTAVLGPPIPRRRARRGDIVMVRGSLGVCRGDLAECLGATVPMREADLAWSASGAGIEPAAEPGARGDGMADSDGAGIVDRDGEGGIRVSVDDGGDALAARG